MNKKIFGRKLSRSRPAREALFSSLIRGMILNGKIVTTHAKAKAIQGDLEHMVTLAKRADIASRRKALSYLDNGKEITQILFNQIGPFFTSRTSGFTRLVRLPERKGDNARRTRIEWTEKVTIKPKEPKVKVKKAEKQVKVIKPLKSIKAKVVKKTGKK
jgi:large subunit ribosomal protein L17